MRPYWEMARQSFHRGLAYRGTFYLRLVGIFLQVVAFYFFWQAIYASATEPPWGLSLTEMLAYVTVSQSVVFTVSLGSDRQIAERMRDGSVALYLMRPVDFYWSHLWESLGAAVHSFIFLTTPLLLAAYLLLGVTLPLAPGRLLLFLTGLLIGFLVMAFIDLLAGILSFLTVNNWGLSMAKNAVLIFFSGALVPLTVLPDWLAEVARYLPFQAVIYLPVSLYLSAPPLHEALRLLVLQVGWAVALLVVGRLALRLTITHLSVQGG